jgi:hypothetical protein
MKMPLVTEEPNIGPSQMRILRCQALQCAVMCYEDLPASHEDVLELAEKYLHWIITGKRG